PSATLPRRSEAASVHRSPRESPWPDACRIESTGAAGIAPRHAEGSAGSPPGWRSAPSTATRSRAPARRNRNRRDSPRRSGRRGSGSSTRSRRRPQRLPAPVLTGPSHAVDTGHRCPRIPHRPRRRRSRSFHPSAWLASRRLAIGPGERMPPRPADAIARRPGCCRAVHGKPAGEAKDLPVLKGFMYGKVSLDVAYDSRTGVFVGAEDQQAAAAQAGMDVSMQKASSHGHALLFIEGRSCWNPGSSAALESGAEQACSLARRDESQPPKLGLTATGEVLAARRLMRHGCQGGGTQVGNRACVLESTDAFDALFTADAGSLHAAEGRTQVQTRGAVVVDPHVTAHHLTADTVRRLGISGPYRAGETGPGIVRHPHRVRLGLEWNHRNDRSELLFGHDAQLEVGIDHDSRADEVAAPHVPARQLRELQHFGAGVLRLPD